MHKNGIAKRAALAALVAAAVFPSGCSKSPSEEVVGLFTKHDVAEVSASKLRKALKQDGKEGLKVFDKNADVLSLVHQRMSVSRALGSKVGVGLLISSSVEGLRVSRVLPGSPSLEAGLRDGDKLLAIAGYSAANMTVAQAHELLAGKMDTPVEIVVGRVDEQGQKRMLKFQVQRKIFKLPNVFYSAEGGTGFLRIVNFSADTGKEVSRAMENLAARGVAAVIIDLRFNQGGYMDEVARVLKLFVGGGKVLYKAQARNPEYAEELKADAQTAPYQSLRLAVLVNKETAAGAEIMALSLKENNGAILVGKRTLGFVSVQKSFKLKDGRFLRLTVSNMAPPSGASITDIGISPDMSLDVPGNMEESILRFWIQHPDKPMAGDPYFEGALKALGKA